jgi:hypothetical protein
MSNLVDGDMTTGVIDFIDHPIVSLSHPVAVIVAGQLL